MNGCTLAAALIVDKKLILQASFAAFLPVPRSYKMLVVEAWNAQDNVVVQLNLESDESYRASSVVGVPKTFTMHQLEADSRRRS